MENPSNAKGKNHGRQPARTSLYRVFVYNAQRRLTKGKIGLIFSGEAYGLDIQESHVVYSTSTSNVGLKVCTTWALMGQAQIPTLSHQNLDHNITAAVPPSQSKSIPSVGVHRRSGEQVSGTSVLEILHWERTNKFLGSARRDCFKIFIMARPPSKSGAAANRRL